MRFFNFLKSKNQLKPSIHIDATEYDSWLTFLERGGSTKEWENLKKECSFVFEESSVERFEKYKKDSHLNNQRYFKLLADIQKNWSVIYKRNRYTGRYAARFESKCLKCIECYKRMREIDKKYGETTPENAPAFKRLAMLYDKQGQPDAAISVCVSALQLGAWGDGMQNRLARMLKKAGRAPTKEEKELLENAALKMPY